MKIMMDDKAVRFTPGGKLYVLDAISALTPIESAEDLWEGLLKKEPHLNQYVGRYKSSNTHSLPVTDSEGWDHIQDYLFDHLIEQVE